jgi:hypothetical protein
MDIAPADHEIRLLRYGPIRTRNWEIRDSDSWTLDDYPLKSICQTCGHVVFEKSFLPNRWFHARDQIEQDSPGIPPELRPEPPS